MATTPVPVNASSVMTFSTEGEANAFKEGLEFFDDHIEVEDVLEEAVAGSYSDESVWAVRFRRVA